ncbi:MAG: ZIP family metal transporter [Candidatus Moranbacteria bacterium]|nr:ZIP family metal transporter [Candidatus Moranbacteria bacterium]
MSLLYAIIATLAVSLISLLGIFTFVLGEKKLKNILFFFISFSAGSLIGGAFFHLLVESLEKSAPLEVFKFTLVGFIVFFVLEKILHWHHCHKKDCQEKKILGIQNLVGDGAHNFIDGLIIVSAFAVDVNLGLTVTLSVMLHEIPQEISDFGVLLYSGFSKLKALAYNLLSALAAVAGVLAGHILISGTQSLVQILLPVTAGGFIYIAASDLIPEINKEKNLKKSILSFVFFLLAILMMLWLRH